MTAEIAILNRVGVALAADSAVTVGRTAGKIWTSADKLFQLSEVDPVAVMVYGNAEHIGIPWETIIKCYRQVHGRESRSHLSDHANQFFAFIKSNRELFPEERAHIFAAKLAATMWLTFRDQMREVLDHQAEEKNGLDETDVTTIYDERVCRLLRALRAQPYVDDFGVSDRAKARTQYAEALDSMYFSKIFGDLPLSKRAKRGLMHAAVLVLLRHFFGPAKCGVVIAGFGAKDYLPALQGYEVESMALDRPRRILRETAEITGDNSATVVPFAQQEMVHAFMNGIDPKLGQFVRTSTRKMFTEAFALLLDLAATKAPSLSSQLEQLKPEVTGLVDALDRDLDAQQEAFWGPVVSNIATLPKDELAAMAEAFVNLTKFRRRVTVERETVGGPIDVAVVTKGDGFVWVRRKHYFDAGLNPRFMAKYRKESTQ